MSSNPARSSRRVIQVVIGIALIALAFGGILLVGGRRITPNQSAQMVGAARDIPAAKAITSDDLKSITVDILPTGAIRDSTLAVGKIARVAISSGSPILDTQLATPAVPAPAKFYFPLAAGKVALNIPATDISPYVQPGDEIDIIATPRGGVPQTKATLKGLKVISVGTPGAPGGNLVVQVSLQEAELLEFLVKNTDFTYVLKSPVDAGATDPTTTGVDLPTFKQAFGFR